MSIQKNQTKQNQLVDIGPKWVSHRVPGRRKLSGPSNNFYALKFGSGPGELVLDVKSFGGPLNMHVSSDPSRLNLVTKSLNRRVTLVYPSNFL